MAGVNSDLGTDLVVHDCHGGDNQLFGFTPFEDGFRMRPRHSRMCIDVEANKPDTGVQLQQWECLNAPNNKFKLVAGGLWLQARGRLMSYSAWWLECGPLCSSCPLKAQLIPQMAKSALTHEVKSWRQWCGPTALACCRT